MADELTIDEIERLLDRIDERTGLSYQDQSVVLSLARDGLRMRRMEWNWRSAGRLLARLERRHAYWTFEDRDGDRAYYFGPVDRAAGPYLKQRNVIAIIDLASDGTFAGVELVHGDLPPPPESKSK